VLVCLCALIWVIGLLGFVISGRICSWSEVGQSTEQVKGFDTLQAQAGRSWRLFHMRSCNHRCRGFPVRRSLCSPAPVFQWRLDNWSDLELVSKCLAPLWLICHICHLGREGPCRYCELRWRWSHACSVAQCWFRCLSCGNPDCQNPGSRK